MQCTHKYGLKLKLVAWAFDTHVGQGHWVHTQGFSYKLCCPCCGKQIG